MLGLRLLVQKGSVDSATQDWGVLNFVASPSPGDRIAVEHDSKIHYLTVLSVHHKPVSVHSISGSEASDTPEADVVAIWTGSD